MTETASLGEEALPDDVRSALEGDAAAARRFGALPPSHRREHLRWIADAKRPETRRRRLEATIERLNSESET